MVSEMELVMTFGFSITVNCDDGTEHDILAFTGDASLASEAVKNYFEYPNVTSLVIVVTKERLDG